MMNIKPKLTLPVSVLLSVLVVSISLVTVQYLKQVSIQEARIAAEEVKDVARRQECYDRGDSFWIEETKHCEREGMTETEWNKRVQEIYDETGVDVSAFRNQFIEKTR